MNVCGLLNIHIDLQDPSTERPYNKNILFGTIAQLLISKHTSSVK